MEDPLTVAPGVAIPLAEIELRTSRSSGPGGQHANVTASRVEVVFEVEDSTALDDEQKERIIERLGPRVTAVSQDSRSQARNRELALERLRARLADALVPRPPRRLTQPSRKAEARRIEAKRRAGERKRSRQPPAIDE